MVTAATSMAAASMSGSTTVTAFNVASAMTGVSGRAMLVPLAVKLVMAVFIVVMVVPAPSEAE